MNGFFLAAIFFAGYGVGSWFAYTDCLKAIGRLVESIKRIIDEREKERLFR